jgi:hypothetical protein
MAADLVDTVIRSVLDYRVADEQMRERRWMYEDPEFTARIDLAELVDRLDAVRRVRKWPRSTPDLRRLLVAAGDHPPLTVPLGAAVAVASSSVFRQARARAAVSAEPGLRAIAAAVSRDPATLSMLSLDPCTVVRAAVALNRHTPAEGPEDQLFRGPVGLEALSRDPIGPIRALVTNPDSHSSDDDSESSEPRLGMADCSCVPQSGAPRSLTTSFSECGLMLPAGVPSWLSAQVREFGPWRWATQPMPEPLSDYMMASFDYLYESVPDHVAFSHAGHGVNSYSLNLRLAVGPIAVLLQTGWGGVYMDAADSTQAWNSMMTELSALLRTIDTAGALGYRQRQILIGFSEFRGGFSVQHLEAGEWRQIPDIESWDDVRAAVAELLPSPASSSDSHGDVHYYRYDPPDQDESAVAGVAVVEIPGEDPFAVAAIQLHVEADGEVRARMESVLREPFDVSLGIGQVANPLREFTAASTITLNTPSGPITVRPVQPADTSWLSTAGVEDLPVAGLEQLVRAIHQVEADNDGGPWTLYNPQTDDEVEFFRSCVSEEDGVTTLAYAAGYTEEDAWGNPTWQWRANRAWCSEKPDVDWDYWYPVRKPCVDMMVETFDSGQWISDDAAYVASLNPERDFTIHNLQPQLLRRLNELLQSDGIKSVDAEVVPWLESFADGTLYADPIMAFRLIVELDATDTAHNPQSGTPGSSLGDEQGASDSPQELANWLVTVDFEPGANADEGGPWRAVVTRLLEYGATSITRDTSVKLPGVRVDRGHDGGFVRVTIDGTDPLMDAIRRLDLDIEAFGTPALWGGPFKKGWVVRKASDEPFFPFRTDPSQIRKRARTAHIIELFGEEPDDAEEDGWRRLTAFVAALVALTDDVVVVEANSPAFTSGNPYVQLCREDGGALTLEAVSSQFLDPPLSPDAINTLHELGWEPPQDAQLPNYTMWLKPGRTAPGDVARLMVQTLRRAYSVRPGDAFSFAPHEIYLELIHGQHGPEFALNPDLPEARKARAVLGLRFPNDLRPPD